MPCGCQKRGGVASQADLARGDGGYLNLKNNDDGQAYYGPHQDETILVVGKGTAEERLFRRDQLAEASAHAQEYGRVLIQQAASNLPMQAVTLLFEGANV